MFEFCSVKQRSMTNIQNQSIVDQERNARKVSLENELDFLYSHYCSTLNQFLDGVVANETMNDAVLPLVLLLLLMKTTMMVLLVLLKTMHHQDF